MLSCSVLADDTKPSNGTVPGGITYTIKPGYKYFRLDCERHSYIYTNEYTLTSDKKEITLIDDDGEWVQIVNAECKITMVKP